MVSRSAVEGPGSMFQWRKMMYGMLGSENKGFC